MRRRLGPPSCYKAGAPAPLQVAHLLSEGNRRLHPQAAPATAPRLGFYSLESFLSLKINKIRLLPPAHACALASSLRVQGARPITEMS